MPEQEQQPAAEERMNGRIISSAVRAMSTTTTSGRALQPTFLACNVYISAGSKPSHEKILLELLREAQSKSSLLAETSEPTTSSTSSSSILDDPSSWPFLSTLEQKRLLSSGRLPPVMIVHAFSDPVYNRSSIHLAGTRADAMAHVCSSLAISAIQKLQQEQNKEEDLQNDNVHEHPFVGFVDHVAVMPLLPLVEQEDDGDSGQGRAGSQHHKNKRNANPEKDKDDFQPISASGWAARAIGQAMASATSTSGVKLIDEVYYYGDAHPLGTPLATVRRERTRFFRTGGCATSTNDTKSNIGHSKRPKPAQQQVATVGAPTEFVENYNIRMSQHCSKAMAQSLTRHVRERDGGLNHVEALSLPYSNGRWEVACNLLRPNTSTTASDVERAVGEWEERQRKQVAGDEKAEHMQLVEQGYRVGTTTEQCLQILISCADDTEKIRKHDEMVALRLKEFIQQQ